MLYFKGLVLTVVYINDASVAPEFLEAFMSVVFNPDKADRSVIPFFYISERYLLLYKRSNQRSVPDQIKTYMRENLVTKVLTFLLMKRPIDCNRRDFFAYAEAFSALVKLEFVSVTGAYNT
jgi:hypothetical protein